MCNPTCFINFCRRLMTYIITMMLNGLSWVSVIKCVWVWNYFKLNVVLAISCLGIITLRISFQEIPNTLCCLFGTFLYVCKLDFVHCFLWVFFLKILGLHSRRFVGELFFEMGSIPKRVLNQIWCWKHQLCKGRLL